MDGSNISESLDGDMATASATGLAPHKIAEIRRQSYLSNRPKKEKISGMLMVQPWELPPTQNLAFKPSEGQALGAGLLAASAYLASDDDIPAISRSVSFMNAAEILYAGRGLLAANDPELNHDQVA